MKKYKEEEEVKDFLIEKYRINYEQYSKAFYDENELDNISSFVLKETDEGYPISMNIRKTLLLDIPTPQQIRTLSD